MKKLLVLLMIVATSPAFAQAELRAALETQEADRRVEPEAEAGADREIGQGHRRD